MPIRVELARERTEFGRDAEYLRPIALRLVAGILAEFSNNNSAGHGQDSDERRYPGDDAPSREETQEAEAVL